VIFDPFGYAGPTIKILTDGVYLSTLERGEVYGKIKDFVCVNSFPCSTHGK
jgi:hypothetical protein